MNKTAVATCAIVSSATMVLGSVLPTDIGGKGELPSYRMLGGLIFTFTGLSVLAEAAPAWAGGIAVLITTTIVLSTGADLLDKYATPQPQKGTAPHAKSK